MGVFGIGTNVRKVNSGIIKGNTYPIACMAWYAPDNTPRPLLFKFEGYDGIIQTVTDITIKCTDDKVYSGKSSKEYKCEAVIGGIRHGFKLIFYILNCQWVMVI